MGVTEWIKSMAQSLGYQNNALQSETDLNPTELFELLRGLKSQGIEELTVSMGRRKFKVPSEPFWEGLIGGVSSKFNAHTPHPRFANYLGTHRVYEPDSDGSVYHEIDITCTESRISKDRIVGRATLEYSMP